MAFSICQRKILLHRNAENVQKLCAVQRKGIFPVAQKNSNDAVLVYQKIGF